jgi:hypothetical protein
MSPKSFASLAVATAVAVVLAGQAIVGRDVPAASRTLDEPMFPGLIDRLDEVAAIEVEAGGTTTTMRRDGEVWRLDDRGGYPVDPAKVRDVARGVAGLRLVEAKTASRGRLPRLELEEPSDAQAKSRRIKLAAPDGTAIAEVVLGKETFSLFGAGRGGIYVRRASEDQAWLAAGAVDLPGDAIAWLDREVIDVAEGDVARVTLAAGSSAPVVIVKDGRDAESFTLDALAEGERADADKLARVAGTLSALTFSDVRPAAAKPVPADAPTARFETWDGLVITAAVLREGEGDTAEHWVKLDASDAAPIAPAPAAEGAEAPRPLAERVAEIDRKVAGWSFQLPRYVADRLLYTRADLLAKPEGTS